MGMTAKWLYVGSVESVTLKTEVAKSRVDLKATALKNHRIKRASLEQESTTGALMPCLGSIFCHQYKLVSTTC
jgi:hypothetical protein